MTQTEGKYYTVERNVQIVISLLKQHGIKHIIASPGTTNMTFVVSAQNDSWFKIWSAVDERSAAYMACGMAAETNEPVVISCTGATASRNYMPGLTEAYYRKLPVLAITSTRGNHKLGHLIDQQIDRRQHPADIVTESVTIPMVKDAEDERFCEIEVNKALLALRFNGGGPSHINLYTKYNKDFSVKEIIPARAIFRFNAYDRLPPIPDGLKIAVYIGSHADFSLELQNSVDRFCSTHNAIVLCDHTSGYRGKYKVNAQLLFCQKQWVSEFRKIDLCIHIGEVSGDPYKMWASSTWRVSPDGSLRDLFGNLRNVFMMSEKDFFDRYSLQDKCHTEFLNQIRQEIIDIKKYIPDIPFSNIWIAQQMADKLPENTNLFLGIYHCLRSWDFFHVCNNVTIKSNVGGFGIDGGMSSMIGSSLIKPNKLHIGIFGDLGFFYDMNVIGNRHIGNNVRILLINNGRGNEFRNYDHPCCFLGDAADEFIAAAGHFGNKSPQLVMHYATDLGFEYLFASNKEEFTQQINRFLTSENLDKPLIFEVFTEKEEESRALEIMMNLKKSPIQVLKSRTKSFIHSIIE